MKRVIDEHGVPRHYDDYGNRITAWEYHAGWLFTCVMVICLGIIGGAIKEYRVVPRSVASWNAATKAWVEYQPKPKKLLPDYDPADIRIDENGRKTVPTSHPDIRRIIE